MASDDIKQIGLTIGKKFKPQKVILFGSRAWGKPHKDSDIDLCVIKKTDDTKSLSSKIYDLFASRIYPMDVLVYTPEYINKRLEMNDLFLRKIMFEGKTLYEE